ncbi:MAG: iron ABC transporter substrate-binding protein [Gammaproteobacteria bacterium]
MNFRSYSRIKTSLLRPLGILFALMCLGSAGAFAPAAAADTLTLYAGQHEQMVRLLIGAFEKQTGIHVNVRYGEGPQLANQLILEGERTPADVFFTENSPELVRLQEKGLLAPVDKSTLAQIPARYSSDKGTWVGVLARENVLTYNPKLIRETALPKSLLDLARPEWRGKIAIAPDDSDFLPLVGAVAAKAGREAALKWLEGLKRNSQIFQDDEGVAAAVNHGAVATGIVNNYYYYRLRQQMGPTRMQSAIHHFSHGDVGALINVSGAAVLKYSHHQAEAQRLLAFMVSAATQRMLAQSNVDFEYPLRPGVAANPELRPFDQLQPPDITVSQLGDNHEAFALLQQAGIL